MTSTELLLLYNEFRLIAHSLFDLLAAKANDDNITPGARLLGSIEYMLQHGFSAHPVQNLWQRGLHARPLACG